MVKSRTLALSALVFGLSSLQAAPHKTEAEQLFGYNPNYTAYVPGDKKVAVQVLHGFGCRRGENYKAYFPGNEHYTGVFFDFKDTLFFKNRSWNLEALRGARSINLGQAPDAEVALYSLIQTHKVGGQSIIFGHSRGGATAITMLHMMEFPEYYIKSWEKLGYTKKIVVKGRLWNGTKSIIDADKLTALKKSIKKIFIEKPLLNINHIINGSLQCSLDSTTAFRRHAQQPIELLNDLVDKGIAINFTLAEHDDMVSNRADAQLMELAHKAGWTVTKVAEDHNDVKTTISMIENYINQLFPAPQPIVAQTHKKVCTSCQLRRR